MFRRARLNISLRTWRDAGRRPGAQAPRAANLQVMDCIVGMRVLKRFTSALKSGLSVLSPDCREVSRLQAEALAGKLPLLRRLGLRIHLGICSWCRRYGKEIRFLHQAAHEPGEEGHPAPAPGLSPEARERLTRSLRNESK